MTNDYGNLELHKILLSAMKDIDKICRENGITYFLDAGTLLGAVNHAGFIPWDDDVDITMLRTEYERFVKIIKTEYKDKYYMQTYESDPYYRNNRAVLRVLGTRLKYNHSTKYLRHTEIGLDIVPLYYAPKTRIMQNIQHGLIWMLDAAVQVKYGDIIPQRTLTKCLKIPALLPRKFLGKCMDFVMKSMQSKKSELIGILCNMYRSPYNGLNGYDNDMMPREWYENTKEILFENQMFMTVCEPEKNLIRRYGPHYAEPYPEEKRITKHDVDSYEISKQVRERIQKEFG